MTRGRKMICWGSLSPWRRELVDWAARETSGENGRRWETERRDYTAEIGFIFLSLLASWCEC